MKLSKKSPGSVAEYVWEKAGDVVDVADDFAVEILNLGTGEFEQVIGEVKKAVKKTAAAKKTEVASLDNNDADAAAVTE